MTIYLLEEGDDGYLLNLQLKKKMSFYITSTPLGEEDDEYLLDKILSKTGYDDVPWKDEDDTHFQVDMEREEAWLYPEDLSPIYVLVYNPHRIPKENLLSLEQFLLPPEVHLDPLVIRTNQLEAYTVQAENVIDNTSDVTNSLCNLQIAPCHVASRTTEAKSFGTTTRARGKALARSSDVTMVNWNNKEEDVPELGISELFDPQLSEVCEIR